MSKFIYIFSPTSNLFEVTKSIGEKFDIFKSIFGENFLDKTQSNILIKRNLLKKIDENLKNILSKRKVLPQIDKSRFILLEGEPALFEKVTTIHIFKKKYELTTSSIDTLIKNLLNIKSIINQSNTICFFQADTHREFFEYYNSFKEKEDNFSRIGNLPIQTVAKIARIKAEIQFDNKIRDERNKMEFSRMKVIEKYKFHSSRTKLMNVVILNGKTTNNDLIVKESKVL
jgi:hypothetical protein